MKRKERLDRVRELASTLVDIGLDDTERAELNGLLRGDPEACECYLEMAEIHAALAHENESIDLPVDPDRVLSFPSSPARKPTIRSTAIWKPLTAAAAVVALLLNGFAFLHDNDSESEEESAIGGVAVLSRIVDPVWAGEAATTAEGSSIAAGEFRLESGLAQLEFFSGATVIVEGPAELDLVSDWEVICRSGRLRAFVPEPARGFIIATPEYKAVDLGTEFALSVDDGRSEVHVVDGEVRIDGQDGKELQMLHGGTGIRSEGGVFETVESGGNGFIDRRTLMQLSNEDSQSRYRKWEERRDALTNDPATMVLFDFENQDPWDRQLGNRSDGGPNGAIIGARWTEGRWPGKGALDFKRITDRVRLNLPGEFDALTFAAWVRVESFDRWLSSLLLTDGFETGEVHWQISDTGKLILGISNDGAPNTESSPVIRPEDLGRWIHLAVTVDRSSGWVTHYLDGERVTREKRSDLPPLRLGSAEIGNWQAKGKHNSIRSFNGVIDEFLIVERAMTPGEIRELHAAGK